MSPRVTDKYDRLLTPDELRAAARVFAQEGNVEMAEACERRAEEIASRRERGGVQE